MSTVSYSNLLAILNQSKVQKTDQALYNTIKQLLQLLDKNQSSITNDITVNSDGIDSPILTYDNALATLPNSRELIAGTNISFDDSIGGERIINASGSSNQQASGAVFISDFDEPDAIVIPGPQGNPGVAGASGANGVSVLALDGIDGLDSFIPGPQGQAGPQGSIGIQGNPGVSVFAMDGEDGQDSFIPGPPGASGGGGGANISSTVFGSEPASPNTGDLDFYSNSFYIVRYSGSAWIPWGPIFPLTNPQTLSFSWVNQGGATVTTTNGGIFLSAPATAGDNPRLRVITAPATPYTITVVMIPITWGFNTAGTAVNNAAIGMLFRESSTGKFVTITYQIYSSGMALFIQKWTNATTFSAQYLTSQLNTSHWLPMIPYFIQINDDGVNLNFLVSGDGINFIQVFSKSRTDWMAGGPDQVGFYVNAGNATNNAGVTLLSWAQS